MKGYLAIILGVISLNVAIASYALMSFSSSLPTAPIVAYK